MPDRGPAIIFPAAEVGADAMYTVDMSDYCITIVRIENVGPH